MEFDITTLIQEIKARKPLWQRDNYNRSCRDVINKLWNEVATKMGVPKELVKTKWKGLRDNFRSELRKIPKKHHVHQSKWIYFSDMMFIKDQMTSRSLDTSHIVSGDAENVNVDVDVYTIDDDDGLIIDETQIDNSGYFASISPFISDNCNRAQLHDTSDMYSFGCGNGTVVTSDGLLPSANINLLKQTGKHSSLNDRVSFFKESILDEEIPIKRRKMNANKNDCSVNLSNDDDFYFLMSFLPTMKTLPPDKRMFLRFKIQCLVYNEVYNNKKIRVK